MSLTAYLNLLTKEKEIELKMENHKNNLKNMKSINNNQPELNPIEINKSKAKYFKNRRNLQIYVENEVLTHKIQKIIKSSKNSKYHSESYKYSRSLNKHVNRVAQQKIDQDNLKLIVRLQESKPTYSTKKYLQSFEQLKKIEKKMSSSDFYLTDCPAFRKRKLNGNRSFFSGRNSSCDSNSSHIQQKEDKLKQCVKLNDGNIWEISIFRQNNELKITGKIIKKIEKNEKNKFELKQIKMPIAEANIFLKKNCQNILKNFIDYLKVDLKDGQLMLITSQKSRSPSSIIHLNNPEQKKGGIKFKKLEQLSGNLKKVHPRQTFNVVNTKAVKLQTLIKQSQRQGQNQTDKNTNLQGSLQMNEPTEKKLNQEIPVEQHKEKITQVDIKHKQNQEVIEKKQSVSNKSEQPHTKQNQVSQVEKEKKENCKQQNIEQQQKKTLNQDIPNEQPEQEINQYKQGFQQPINHNPIVESDILKQEQLSVNQGSVKLQQRQDQDSKDENINKRERKNGQKVEKGEIIQEQGVKNEQKEIIQQTNQVKNNEIHSQQNQSS